jgi:hypothetical protein
LQVLGMNLRVTTCATGWVHVTKGGSKLLFVWPISLAMILALPVIGDAIGKRADCGAGHMAGQCGLTTFVGQCCGAALSVVVLTSTLAYTVVSVYRRRKTASRIDSAPAA